MKKSTALCLTIVMLALWAGTALLLREKKAVPKIDAAVTLTVDVIPGADVGSGSRENWLRSRAEEFEAKHPNVYITVRALKTDQARTIYENDMREYMGNLVAFSTGGFSYRDILLPLVVPQRERIVSSLACSAGDCAAAYMYGGYVLLADRASLAGKDVQNAQEAAQMLREISQRADDDVSFAACADANDSGVIAAALGLGTDGAFARVDTRAYCNSLFSAQTCGVMTASHYTAYRFMRMAANGDANDVELLPLASGFTDQVHYIGVVDSQKAQNDAACAFVGFLLEDAAQEKTADIGMFPATNVQTAYEEGTILQTLFSCQKEPIICPDAFAWSLQRQTAQALAQEILAGTANALRDLEKLLQSDVDRNAAMR